MTEPKTGVAKGAALYAAKHKKTPAPDRPEPETGGIAAGRALYNSSRPGNTRAGTKSESK